MAPAPDPVGSRSGLHLSRRRIRVTRSGSWVEAAGSWTQHEQIELEPDQLDYLISVGSEGFGRTATEHVERTQGRQKSLLAGSAAVHSTLLPFTVFCCLSTAFYCALLCFTCLLLLFIALYSPLLPFLLPFTAFYCPLLPSFALYCPLLPFLLPFTACCSCCYCYCCYCY